MQRRQYHNKFMIPALPILHDFEGSIEEKEAFQKALQDVEFQQATTFCEQVGSLCRYLRTDKILVSYGRIGMVFEESKDCVKTQNNNYNRGPGIDGRPPSLTTEQIQKVIDEIRKYHLNSPPVYPTFELIADFIFLNFDKNICPDTLRHLFYQKMGSYFKTCLGKPMEDKRLECNTFELELNINTLSSLIEGVPIHFIYNVDEMGHQDYADSHTKFVIVPNDFEGLVAPYSVSRKGQRCSCLACINPNGLASIPQFIVPRATIDEEMIGLLPLDSLQVVQTDKGYTNTFSFSHWLKTCFFPYLRSQRTLHNYSGRAVLIMDGYKSHDIALNRTDLSRENLVVHFLKSHSSDQTQPLDIGVFGATKTFQSNFKPRPELTKLTNQLLKIHTCLHKACTPMCCRSAFRAIGITSKIIDNDQSKKIEVATFDLKLCSKIRMYSLTNIQQLRQNNIPLTPNQITILSHSSAETPPPKRKYIKVPSFKKKKGNKKLTETEMINQNKNVQYFMNPYINK